MPQNSHSVDTNICTFSISYSLSRSCDYDKYECMLELAVEKSTHRKIHTSSFEEARQYTACEYTADD